MKIACACLTSLFATTARADLVSLSPSHDTTLYQSAAGDLANGAGSGLFAGTNGTGLVRRGLLAFDLSAIPDGATITGATLRLTMTQSSGGTATCSLHRLLATWGEGASVASGNGGGGTAPLANDATWLHRFFPGPTWASAGGDFAATASATTNVAGVGVYEWASPSLAADVQAWLDGSVLNAGWLLRGDESAPASAKRFASREAPTTADRPTLVVTYTIPAPAGAALAALGFSVIARRRR